MTIFVVIVITIVMVVVAACYVRTVVLACRVSTPVCSGSVGLWGDNEGLERLNHALRFS